MFIKNMAKRCSTKNPCKYPRADWWQATMGTDWYNRGTSTPVVPDYSIYPSTDRAIIAGAGASGSGTKGYLAFGGQAISPVDNSLYFSYRQGDAHQSGLDGDTKIIRSTDLWVTHSGPITVLANPGGGTDLGSTHPFVCSTGRVLIFYTKSSVSLSTGYLKYSDTPDLSVLSSEIRFTTDYNGQFIDITGTCIEINGVLYKNAWATTGVGGTEVVVYKSLDFGLTWTRISYISSSQENYDETTLAVHPITGVVYAFQRDNSSQELLIKSSSDGLLTWSSVIHTGIGAKAKHGACITPQGVFCVVTRTSGPGGRTILAQSRSATTGWTSQNIDGRDGLYVYGNPIWHPVQNKIIAVWCVEAKNVPTAGASGPTVIICKELIQSTTTVTPPTTYNAIYQGWLDFGQANNETLPSGTFLSKSSTLITSLDTAGKLSNCDTLILSDSSIPALSKRNVRRPWRVSTVGDAPTYGDRKIDFDGVNDYLNVNTTLSQQLNFTQDSAEITIYIPDNEDAGPAYGTGTGTANTRTNACFFNPRSAGNLFAILNGGALMSFANTDSSGLWELKRTVSTGFDVYHNGVLFCSFTVNSSGRSSSAFIVGAEQFIDQIKFFSTRANTLIALGGPKTSWYTEVSAYVS